MRLIIGGYAQGKLAYVQKEKKEKELRLFEGIIPTKEQLLELNEQGKVPVVNRLHDFVKQSLLLENHPEKELQAFLEDASDCIIISDEIGNGIVPVDAFEREYRERTGRILVELARQADEVIRVICGIGQKIK